jgi:endonuclease/exonuclease/phosphatase family metal-dependent hydrolase
MKNCIAVLLLVMWPALLLHAAPICVTTWDLQSSAMAGANGESNKFQQSLFQEAAKSLKTLHPDVILLQQVPDRETCQQLAQALQPEAYQVAVCSSFRDPRTKLLSRQVAILSKAKAYLAWSEPWQNSGQSPAAPGGFAFAAIRVGDKNIGMFSVQLSDGASLGTADSGVAAFQQASDDSARQLITEIGSLQNWKAHQLQAFIVSGDFNTAPELLPLVHEKILLRLEQIGFESAFAGLPLQQRVTLPGNAWRPAATLDYIFTRDAGLAAPPVATQSALSEHDAVTFEMDSTAPKTALASLPLVNPTANLPITSAGSHQTLWWFAGCLAGCLVFFGLARKLLRRSEFQTGAIIAASQADQYIIVPPSEGPPYVQVEIEGSTQTQSQTWHPRPDAGRMTTRMPEVVRAGIIANLSRWLKREVVRRLVSDRAQLLATQQAAALKVLAVDERLVKVERHIQQRNQEYERRIDDLLKALVTAREENRELIRAKIALLKAEMEKARLKADQHGTEHQRY